MVERYRIYGAELSPYSVKVRSYFRYKAIEHEWLSRSGDNAAEFQKYARLPLIPLVVTPEDEGLQDSTPILEKLEERYPEPSIHPRDQTLRFLSELIEEYGDEWGNKGMFHYRWWREADQQSAGRRIAHNMLGDEAAPEALEAATAKVVERMVPRLSFVGSNEETKETIEASFLRQVTLLEAHLKDRLYLLGGRPALADFGWWGQIYNAWTDPTPKALVEERTPGLVAWIRRMLEPKAEGEFEDWEMLAPTLMPVLRAEIAGLFLPWSVANAAALQAGEPEFSVELAGGVFTQQTQKYHARSLAAIRAKYQAIEDRSQLDPILKEAGCLQYLA